MISTRVVSLELRVPLHINAAYRSLSQQTFYCRTQVELIFIFSCVSPGSCSWHIHAGSQLTWVMEPLLIGLVTPLRFLLYKVKMSAVNKGLLMLNRAEDIRHFSVTLY